MLAILFFALLCISLLTIFFASLRLELMFQKQKFLQILIDLDNNTLTTQELDLIAKIMTKMEFL